MIPCNIWLDELKIKQSNMSRFVFFLLFYLVVPMYQVLQDTNTQDFSNSFIHSVSQSFSQSSVGVD